MKRIWILSCAAALCAGCLDASILYAGLGGHSISCAPIVTSDCSINDGALATVNQTTGAVSVIGQPANVSRISGLAFDTKGVLFAATQPGGGFPPPPGPTGGSMLLNLNTANGSIISSFAIRDGSTAISVADLAVQPGTGTLFGIRGPNDQLNGQGKLYTINKTTGAATLLGDTGDFFGSIAFAPNGTLYMGAADLDMLSGNLINIGLKRLNPATAATLSFVPTTDFLSSLDVRPEDSVIFGGNGDMGQLFRINPTTGAETLIGSTGRTFVGDLAFTPVPEPMSLALVGVGCVALLLRKRGSGYGSNSP